MNTENPYMGCPKPSEHVPDLGGCTGDMHDAWEEGYHSRDEIVDDLVEALEGLIGRYWRNKGSNGTFPHPGEFIACITPIGIPEHWQQADRAIANATEI